MINSRSVCSPWEGFRLLIRMMDPVGCAGSVWTCKDAVKCNSKRDQRKCGNWMINNRALWYADQPLSPPHRGAKWNIPITILAWQKKFLVTTEYSRWQPLGWLWTLEILAQSCPPVICKSEQSTHLLPLCDNLYMCTSVNSKISYITTLCNKMSNDHQVRYIYCYTLSLTRHLKSEYNMSYGSVSKVMNRSHTQTSQWCNTI